MDLLLRKPAGLRPARAIAESNRTVAAPCAIVAAVNDQWLFKRTLLQSPALAARHMPVYPMTGFRAAGAAYNAGLDRSTEEIVIFAHQDVYFPLGWDTRLAYWIAQIEKSDPHWGLIGVYGLKDNGQRVGRLWCSGAGTVFGEPRNTFTPVQSLDEVVLVLRRNAGLRFDEKLPGFHMYGTDMPLQARAQGMQSYVIDAPIIHNTRPLHVMTRAYWKAYRYMVHKWAAALPVWTSCVRLTRWGWPRLEMLNRYQYYASRLRGPRFWDGRVENLAQLAQQAGFIEEAAEIP